jgi:hypothetical protein
VRPSTLERGGLTRIFFTKQRTGSRGPGTIIEFQADTRPLGIVGGLLLVSC